MEWILYFIGMILSFWGVWYGFKIMHEDESRYLKVYSKEEEVTD